MKNKFIITAFLSAFLLIAADVKAANFADYQTVDTNKTWIIKFTSEVELDDTTKQGITVTDSKGNEVSVGIQLGQDSKTVTVAAPEDGYTAGENYILNVGTKAHSSKDKSLKNEYKLHFSIMNNDTNNIVSFKDKQLEKVIRGKIKKPTGDIYKSDVEKITELNSYDFLTDWDRYNEDFIKDISGIEELTNLRELSLGDNLISDISSLKRLTKLEYLNLHGNQNISDLSPLRGLTKLQYLDLTSNMVSNISPLEGLTNLQELWMPDCWLKSTSGFEKLTGLKILNLVGNSISNADIESLRNKLPNCEITFGP